MPASYKDLLVWQKSIQLVAEIYTLFDNMPHSERYALIDQMRRSAISIPSNIAEGQGRGSDKDFAKFLFIARGSLYELETQIELCKALKYFTPSDLSNIVTLESEVGKMLNAILKKLTANS